MGRTLTVEQLRQVLLMRYSIGLNERARGWDERYDNTRRPCKRLRALSGQGLYERAHRAATAGQIARVVVLVEFLMDTLSVEELKIHNRVLQHSAEVWRSRSIRDW